MTATRQAVTLLIGLDDTDNLESCGTGFHARTLGAAMADHGWGVSHFITRHQLLVSPLVAYTSHNSAACVRVETEAHHLPAIEQYCVDYLARHSAEGSDAGLCLVEETRVTATVQRFGFLCKRRWVAQQQARALAQETGLVLHGLTGTRDGVIGALAAVGLHASGSDGRLLWLPGLRELAERQVPLAQVYSGTGVDAVQNTEGALLPPSEDIIDMGGWPRAVWLGGQATLIVEQQEAEHGATWRVASKNYLKQF